MLWRIGAGPARTTIFLSGDINEHADFGRLAKELPASGTLQFDLREVQSINSCGVREWMQFMRQFISGRALVMVRCSPAIVLQLNSVHNFRGAARIESVVAPYVCGKCGNEEEHVLDLARDVVVDKDKSMHVPSFRCAECSTALEFDDVPERYLRFITYVAR
jgi:hypothetical protein